MVRDDKKGEARLPRRIRSELDVLVRRLVGRYRPDRVILFGSRAYGRPDPGSDIDILVIKNTRKMPRERRLEVRRILDTPVTIPPVDAIVLTPAEVERRLAMSDDFIRTILRRGLVLYDKAAA